ncbi:hypothetical protein ACU4GD_41265 [Cupriavidus basilensis]
MAAQCGQPWPVSRRRVSSTMTEDILVNITPQETRVAIVQQAAVQELHVERTLSRAGSSAISTWARSYVLPGMQSAFIDIGLERAAFLHVADIWHPRDPEKNGNAAPLAHREDAL